MNDVKRPRSKANAGNYEVGYGRPPVHRRFAPGQCGNPKGRPKGVRNFATDVKDVLKAQVKVTRDGKPRKISTQEATLLRLREKALAGDIRALDRMVQLAQSYNNEEMAAVDSLSADDADVLDVYKARLLNGAAAPNVVEDRQQPAESGSASLSTASAGTPKAAPLKMVRLRRTSTVERNANAEDERK